MLCLSDEWSLLAPVTKLFVVLNRLQLLSVALLVIAILTGPRLCVCDVRGVFCVGVRFGK